MKNNAVRLGSSLRKKRHCKLDDTEKRPFNRTLRIALAMRGGVSLAVWIGGAVAELDILRRIRLVESDGTIEHYLLIAPRADQPLASFDESQKYVVQRARSYAQMLEKAGYDRVEFDVLAGASAGGLNSVIYAVAQRAGVGLDSLLTTWIDAGSIWKLLHGPGFKGVDAPLRGDQHFAAEVKRALNNLFTQSDAIALHRADNIVVDLSATIVDGLDSDNRASRDGRGHFHFVGASPNDPTRSVKEHGRAIPLRLFSESEGADGSESSDAVDLDLSRLAYAARSTSSVPGGFEPALIYSKETSPESLGEYVDMTFAFHMHRDRGDAPYRVIDGGLLDNIPIDRAHRAIRGMASEVYSTRALFYLDPRPPRGFLLQIPHEYDGASLPPTLAPYRRRTDKPWSFIMKVVPRALILRAGGESGEDEARSVDVYRRQLNQAAGRDQALGPLSRMAADAYEADSETYLPEVAIRAYVRYRAPHDLSYLHAILTDPALWQLGTNLPERKRYPTGQGATVRFLDAQLIDTFDALSVSDDFDEVTRSAVVRGPTALVDSALSLLAWVRNLEDSAFANRGGNTAIEILEPVTIYTDLRAIRKDLYRVLGDAQATRDQVVDRILRVPHNLPPAEFAEEVVGLWISPDAADPDERWETLETIVTALRSLSEDMDDELWLQSPWAGLPTRVPISPIECAGFAASRGIPDPNLRLRYWDISAGEVPSSAPEYAGLWTAQRTVGMQAALLLPFDDLTPEAIDVLVDTSFLRPETKLTGSSLAGFAGFLSADWRRNDWWWGRVDAGGSVLRFLESLQAVPDATEGDLPTELVQEAILRDAVAVSPEIFPEGVNPTSSIAEIRAGFLMGGDNTLNLDPQYRVAVVHRGIHAAFRSLQRWTGQVWMPILAFLFVPGAAIAPTFFDPPRALLVAAVLGSTLSIATSSPTVSYEVGVNLLLIGYAAVVLAVAVLSVRSIVDSRQKWGKIRMRSLAWGSAALADVDVQYRRARRKLGNVLALAVVTMAATLYAVGVGQLGPGPAITLATFFAGSLVFAAWQDHRPEPPEPNRLRSTVLTTAAMVLVVWCSLQADFLQSFFADHQPWPSGQTLFTQLPLLFGATCFATSIISNWGWQFGFARWHPVPGSQSAASYVGHSRLIAFAWGILQAVIAGVAASGVIALLLANDDWEASSFLRFAAALIALFAGGLVQWALPVFDIYRPLDRRSR